MKNYIHYYKGYGIHPSSCRVHIKKEENITWIGFENLGEGTSVTNASEQLASEIVVKEKLSPESCRFFEWYSEYEGMLDEITYEWENSDASHPTWNRFCNSDLNPFKEGFSKNK